MTNATKANLIALVNAALGLALAFGVNLTETQTAAILVFANAGFGVFVGLTFKRSKKRLQDDEVAVKVG